MAYIKNLVAFCVCVGGGGGGELFVRRTKWHVVWVSVEL
jgi:hypothetical protein